MSTMTASAPGKLIVTGEYAVLEGAPALVVAVDRRVVARFEPTRVRGSSPFLLAVAAELEARGHAVSAKAALSIAVDSARFYDGRHKLGLGSSAAVTVAATALAMTASAMTADAAIALVDRAEILAIAQAAHRAAQGGRGSGADIAAAVHGGAIIFSTSDTKKRTWPHSVRIVPFFTGHSASTTSLVEQVTAARATNKVAVDAALTAIADASTAATRSLGAPPGIVENGLIAAISLAAAGMDRLAIATGLPLVPPCVTAARTAMARFGGTAKTTGAGGGDIAIAVMPVTADVTAVHATLIEAGCTLLPLSVDETGVDLQANAQ